jgi:hypothetical protein
MDTSPLEVERLLSEDQRRLTVSEHHSWQKSISSQRPFDEVDLYLDQDFDERVVVDPYECHQPSRRSDKELGHLLNLLDSLETGNDRKANA